MVASSEDPLKHRDTTLDLGLRRPAAPKPRCISKRPGHLREMRKRDHRPETLSNDQQLFGRRRSGKAILKKGDTFFEKPGSHHLIACNPDKAEKTVVIAFVINPKDIPMSEPLHGHP